MPLVVNNQAIDDAIIDQEFSAIKAHYESMGSMSCCERDEEFRGYARDNIIFRALLTQEAQRSISEPNAKEVDEAFSKLKKDNGGDDQFYASMSLTPDQDEIIRNDLAMNMQVETLRENIFAEIKHPTEEELIKYYSNNKDQFRDEDEVRASHIFKSVREVEKREEIFNELCGIREKIINGLDFFEIAKSYSDKPEEEIDLGYYKRGELMDEFEIITFSMKLGEVSPVFNTAHGFHLAKVTDRKTGLTKPYEDVKSIIKEELILLAQDKKLREYVEELKSSADIKYTETNNEPHEND
tara:strand:+ start:400 stop:1290 length:891 start_codon:yes stop_codon:yes gene_type:complete